MFTLRKKTDYRYPVSIPYPKGGPRPKTKQAQTRRNKPNKPPPRPDGSHRQEVQRRSRFQGHEEGLEGHTYTLGPQQSERFMVTTKALSNYVGRTFKNGGDVKRSVDQLRVIDLLPPEDLQQGTPEIPEVPGDPDTTPPIPPTPAVPAVPGPTPTEERIWMKEIDEFMKRKTVLERNLENLFSLVWGQCENPLQEKLKALPQYQDIANRCDAMALLRAIREVTFEHESQRYQAIQVFETNRRLTNIRQKRSESISEYLERLQNLVEQVETNKGTVGFTPAMVDVELARLQPPRDTDTATVDEYAEAVSAAKERYLAVVFLSGLAEYRYEQMLRTMDNDYLRGDKQSYPTTLNKAYELATNWRGPGPKKTRGPHRQLELGNTFVQSGGLRGATNNNSTHTHATTAMVTPTVGTTTAVPTLTISPRLAQQTQVAR